MPSQPLTPEDEELQKRIEEITQTMLIALSEWQAGQPVDYHSAEVRGQELFDLIKQRDQQKELEWQRAVIDAMKADLGNYTSKHDAGHVEWFKDFLCLFEMPSNPQKGK